jgi:hypothetical protein
MTPMAVPVAIAYANAGEGPVPWWPRPVESRWSIRPTGRDADYVLINLDSWSSSGLRQTDTCFSLSDVTGVPVLGQVLHCVEGVEIRRYSHRHER